jgi:hypothetical protein
LPLALWLYLLLKNLDMCTQQFRHMGSYPIPLLQIHRLQKFTVVIMTWLYLILAHNPGLDPFISLLWMTGDHGMLMDKLEGKSFFSPAW